MDVYHETCIGLRAGPITDKLLRRRHFACLDCRTWGEMPPARLEGVPVWNEADYDRWILETDDDPEL